MKAFNATINGGYLITPHLLKSITRDVENEDGTKTVKTIYNYETNIESQVISEETSAIIREALVAAVKNGSAYAADVQGYRVGGKTGTAQTYTQSGSISEDVYYTSCSAFAPVDDPQISVYIVSYNPKEKAFGSVCAAPYVGEFLAKALPYLNVERTEELWHHIWTPNVVGLKVEDAVNILVRWTYDVTIEGSGNVVAWQSIEPSHVDAENTPITIRLTDKVIDPDLIQVPSLIGMTKTKANELLALKGLKLDAIGSGEIILDQSFTPGYYVDPGTVITVYFEERHLEEDSDV